MSVPLIALVTIAYFGVSLDQLWKGNEWMALVWLGYAIANVGMMGALK